MVLFLLILPFSGYHGFVPGDILPERQIKPFPAMEDKHIDSLAGQSSMKSLPPEVEYSHKYEYYIPDYISDNQYVNDIDLDYSSVDNPPESREGDIPEFRNPVLKLLKVGLDNDIFNNTDYYYTNGLEFRLVHPSLIYSPTSRLLLPSPRNSRDYYDIGFIQNIYTPIDPDKPEVQIGDRPFAGYTYFEFGKTAINPGRNLLIRSELDLGIIGPGAMAGSVQSSLHEIKPQGWQNQVRNDIVLNYNMGIDKGIYVRNKFIISGLGIVNVGTLYTNASMGLNMSFGNGLCLYHCLSPLEMAPRKFYYSIFLNISGTLVAYDATLQGGVFNRTSIYTIPVSEINRGVLNLSAGFTITYRFAELKVIQWFNTPEFTGAKNFKYVSISIGFKL